MAIKYSVRGRDLGGTVEEPIDKVNRGVKLPTGYQVNWEGEYQSEKRSERRRAHHRADHGADHLHHPVHMFRSLKWGLLILGNVAMARIGGLLALLITGTKFSVSSGVGFLALFGVSVQTGVIMLEYINQLRARGRTIEDSAIEGAVLRLRPIMMTMLVAARGLLPAALSHAIGSDSQRPFAIVIVSGLIADLVMSIFLLPTLYVWIARVHDVLLQPEFDVVCAENCPKMAPPADRWRRGIVLGDLPERIAITGSASGGTRPDVRGSTRAGDRKTCLAHCR